MNTYTNVHKLLQEVGGLITLAYSQVYTFNSGVTIDIVKCIPLTQVVTIDIVKCIPLTQVVTIGAMRIGINVKKLENCTIIVELNPMVVTLFHGSEQYQHT